ncbi:hypothetical protein [Polaribacter glomeratus]|uniref:STAS/SEC14 domain-containing protein n=1 Tax=Polaribacter glomeratus TaxID=102 RepID=A0A2S7WIW0_9FLAO|nr:hypothetical protein [Polaribacter glomeratus]PQJ77251.1 hypothetical protein BTO16_15555 [Polaribacter glomeratus]TXD65101.1 hypothetical protein ESX12_11525 [Polaribacter glomeratus]
MEELAFDEKYAQIYLNKDDKYLKIVWVGFSKSEYYRKALNFGLKLVFDNNLEGWFANVLDMKIVTQRDQDWTNDVWFPEMVKSKLTKMAILTSKHVANQITVNSILTKATEMIPFDTMNFNNEAKGMKWMLSRD